MKKSQLKQILKPIVAECIKESLITDGLISGIVSEVVRGMSAIASAPEAASPEQPPSRMQQNAFGVKEGSKLKEHRQKLMAAVGQNTYNGVDLFEGVSPMVGQNSQTQQAQPLSDQSPSDPGVDISNLFGAVGRSWGAHMNDVKEGK